MDSPGWKIADESASTACAADRWLRRASAWPWDRATRRRMHSQAAAKLSRTTGSPLSAQAAGPAGRSSAASRRGGGTWRERVPTRRAARRRACCTLFSWLAHMAVLLRETKGNAAPAGEHGSPFGMPRPARVEATGWRYHGPGRGAVRQNGRPAVFRSGPCSVPGMTLLAQRMSALVKPAKPPVSLFMAPARWRVPHTGRQERPDRAGPSTRRRVTTATPAGLDFSDAEAPVKALQARCPQVARRVLTGGTIEARLPA